MKSAEARTARCLARESCERALRDRSSPRASLTPSVTGRTKARQASLVCEEHWRRSFGPHKSLQNPCVAKLCAVGAMGRLHVEVRTWTFRAGPAVGSRLGCAAFALPPIRIRSRPANERIASPFPAKTQGPCAARHRALRVDLTRAPSERRASLTAGHRSSSRRASGPFAGRGHAKHRDEGQSRSDLAVACASSHALD